MGEEIVEQKMIKRVVCQEGRENENDNMVDKYCSNAHLNPHIDD